MSGPGSALASGQISPVEPPEMTRVEMSDMEKPAGAAPARDGNIAIQEEFDAAMLANSFAAWELFIRRHPDHPLVEAAWRELRELECSCSPD